MQTLTKQLLIRISPELDDLITKAFSIYLKNAGQYKSRSDYIRTTLEKVFSQVIEEDAHPVTQPTNPKEKS
jgi:Arc/MetJ-type ribon-helix-helix transcriptional regulator